MEMNKAYLSIKRGSWQMCAGQKNSMNKNITYDFLLVLYSLDNTLPSVNASSEAFFFKARFDVGGFPFELLKEVFYIF